MDRFSKVHPAVCFLFFVFEIIITLAFLNPYHLAVSFAAALLYYLRLCGGRRLLSLLRFTLPLILLVAVLNMLFCRYGATVLFSVGSTHFSLEALAYGACTGVMLAAVIVWFSAYSEVITSDKFTALFGGFAPNLVLLFSMVLRFVPLMNQTARELKEGQQGLGNETKGLKNTLRRFSALVSISLERSIETADTMRARGFGKNKRRHYSPYVFRAADAVLTGVFIILFIAQAAAYVSGRFQFSYTQTLDVAAFSAPALILWAVLCVLPLVIDLAEDVKWRFLKSKI